MPESSGRSDAGSDLREADRGPVEVGNSAACSRDGGKTSRAIAQLRDGLKLLGRAAACRHAAARRRAPALQPAAGAHLHSLTLAATGLAEKGRDRLNAAQIT